MTKKQDYDEIEQMLDFQAFVESVREGFKEVEDPRDSDNLTYPLIALLVMILCAIIAGANSIVAISQYAKIKREMFRNLLGVTRAPSYTVFWWLLTRLRPEPLQAAFIQWSSSLAPEIKKRLIAIDGKHLRGVVGEGGVHLVAAWDSIRGVMLGQIKAEEKSNEITAIPQLLDMIDIKGANITIDAAGCQIEIAAKIIEKEGDYTLALKGNQGTLHGEAENFFIQAEAVGFTEDTYCTVAVSVSKEHGRIEEREVAVTNNLDWLDDRLKWKGLKSMVQVTSTRIIQGNESKEKRYYISSKNWTAEQAAVDIRSHWSIENHLHWRLDVIFNEDESLANTGHAAENLAMFRRMSLALIQEEIGGKVGVAKMRRMAAWDDTYMLSILGHLFKETGKTF